MPLSRSLRISASVNNVTGFMPRLIIHNIKTQEEQDYDLPQDNILIGRTNTCDIELPIKSISRRHAEITRENQDYFLSDLASGNGTFLNNKKLNPHEKNLLRSGDTIRIEDYELRFILRDEGAAAIEEDTDTDILEIKLIKKMMRALDSEDIPSLEVLNGTLAGQRVFLSEEHPEFIIGRGDECHLTIPENVLSRSHVKLERKWGGVVVTDLGSKNGTFVNNEPVQEKLLHDGDRIMLGTIKLLYRNPKEIRAQIAHQELTRKKKEAALAQAEALAKKQLEEEERRKQEEEEERARKEAEAKEVEAALEKQKEEEAQAAQSEAEAENEEPAPEAAPTPQPTQPQAPESPQMPPATAQASKFSTIEKVFIGLGILVGILAVIGIIMLLF